MNLSSQGPDAGVKDTLLRTSAEPTLGCSVLQRRVSAFLVDDGASQGRGTRDLSDELAKRQLLCVR